jgi:hypothetical protein
VPIKYKVLVLGLKLHHHELMILGADNSDHIKPDFKASYILRLLVTAGSEPTCHVTGRAGGRAGIRYKADYSWTVWAGIKYKAGYDHGYVWAFGAGIIGINCKQQLQA